MNKKMAAAWAKVRDGQSRIGLLKTNASGRLSNYAHGLESDESDEKLGQAARAGAVAFLALSLACELAASGGEDLIQADPIRMDRRQAFNMGQAAAQRHNVGIFHEISTGFVGLARYHRAEIGDLQEDAVRLSDQILESERTRTTW